MDTDYSPLTYADFYARWESVRRRIFVAKPFPSFTFPFTDRSWEVLPLPNDPTQGFAPLRWLEYDGAPRDYDEYEPLFATLRERGVETFVLWAFDRAVPEDRADQDISPYEPLAFPFEVKPTREALASALMAKGFPQVGHPSYFSAEADWGIHTFWEEVSVLAGTPDFMECFYRHAGGREYVRQRFIDYDVGAAWALAHYQLPSSQLPCGPDGYPYNDAPRKEFYDMIGWEMPAYDMDEIRTAYPWYFREREGG